VDSSIARGILDQARPIFVGQVAVMLYAVVDTVLTGHASATDLAAMGLGAGVYSSVFVSLLGAINALNPIIAQHHGGGRHAAIGVSYVQGLWLALLLSIVGGLFLAFPEPWLGWIHAPSDVEALVTRYLRVLSVALPASLMFRAISALNIAVARPHVVMRMQVAGLALKLVLSYGLIFGALGLPRLGAVGGALARPSSSGRSSRRAGRTRASTPSTAASRSAGRRPAGPSSASRFSSGSRWACPTPSRRRPSPSSP